jgi:uncharacterized protein YndB with AHSA1/START domain
MNDVIEQEVRIEAPIERVRQVITDPAHVARWFGNSAQLDHRPGGPLRFGWDGTSRSMVWSWPTQAALASAR